jgi:hypothetical protein
LPLDKTFFFFHFKNIYKCQKNWNFANSCQDAPCSSSSSSLRKKQDWYYAEVLQLEASLQDASLQPQQGARNLAIPACASAKSIEHNLPGPFEVSIPAPGTPHVHQHNSLNLQLHTRSAIQATLIGRKF